MVAIIPSLLEHTPPALRARLQLVESHHVPLVQLDVADHTFVPSATFFDPDFLNTLQPKVAFEVHLMTRVTPESLNQWRRPWVKKIIFHLEATAEPRRILQEIRRIGKLAGIAINPETPVAAARPFLSQTDTLLVMGVTPGWGRQQLLPDTVPRLRAARRLHRHGNVEVDGSVNVATIQALAAAGANLMVVGSALTAKNFTQQLHRLTTLAHAAYQTTFAP